MININNISFSYQVNEPVLKKIDLRIHKGSLFGLLGPNGAGKSTLISLIAGLYEPTHGSVSINDMDYSSSRNTILAKLAVAPQEYAFYLQLSVIENIEFFASLYHKNHVQIEKAIDLTGLGEHKSKIANTLSGGLKRRLNLAVGLLNEPEILILDEPTVGIDPQSRHFILQAIKDINTQGTTIIYTSHYMEEVEQLCDAVAIMDHGRILKHGALDTILESEQHIEVFVENTEIINNLTDEFKSKIKLYGLKIDDQTLCGELVAGTSLKELLGILEQNHVPVAKVRYGKQTLESLFFSLTHSSLRD